MNISSLNIADPNGRDANKIYISSGERTESALIDTGTGVVGAIVVITDGTNDAECVVYDGTDNTGDIVARCPVKGSDKLGGQVIPFRVTNGIYATITGTGAKYHIYYL
jgi:hypothetical protein